MPNVRTVVLKPEVPSKWSQETSLKLVLLALGPASPKIESLDPSDFPVGPDNSSTASHNWHRRWYRIDDISRELVEFCWHGKHLGDAFPKLRKLKIAKNVRRSSNGRSLVKGSQGIRHRGRSPLSDSASLPYSPSSGPRGQSNGGRLCPASFEYDLSKAESRGDAA
ncbi:hypothetical protein Rt10032_c11g4392 [Rhodotorula toruloides]|uniref:Uncharacterized protein n=1 Tax=Rhodotorula toruloides TaxID=5286 RepID=A0A511KKD0_RHOTO|nr:hypothetical protein Rt10032_c11g4392 [Rhodotorula toruloides]